MDNHIDFSIIIPAFNARNYISDAIGSIQKQEYTNYEIIVVDDSSTDNTFATVEKLQQHDSRIRLFKQPNGKGASDARNFGMTKAVGKYLLFVDADDFYCDKSLLKTLSDEISQNNEPDLVYFGYYECKKRDTSFSSANKEQTIKSLSREDIIRRTIFPTNTEFSDYSIRAASPWAKAYKREFIQLNKIVFPSGIRNSEDAIFNLRVLSCRPSFVIANIRAYYYWNNSENSGHRYMPEFKAEFEKMTAIFSSESEPFKFIPEYEQRLNLRLYSYLIKVLNQYYLHNQHIADDSDSLASFIRRKDILEIARKCESRNLPVSQRIVQTGIKLGNTRIVRLGVSGLANIKNKLRRFFK